MKTHCLFLFIMLSIASNSQNVTELKTYYKSGELKIEGQTIGGKRFGEWKNYYKNSQVSRIYSYNKGKLNKENVYYYKNGIIKSKTEKVNSQYVRFTYYESGKLKTEENLDKGEFKSFYEDGGSLDVLASKKKNEIVGVWKKHFRNGGVEWLVNYKDGYRDGVYKQFYDNGDLKLQGHNSKDQPNGEEKRYLKGNVLEWKGSYKKGVMAKTWTRYNENGKTIESIKFKNGTSSDKVLNAILTPTSVVEGVTLKIPIFPGCEGFLNNTQRKQCANEAINKHVAKKFNTNLAKKFGLSPGVKRIAVQFKVDKSGSIIDILTKGPHPGLEKEAKRVINLLPKVKPGAQSGNPIIMPYALPIAFYIPKSR